MGEALKALNRPLVPADIMFGHQSLSGEQMNEILNIVEGHDEMVSRLSAVVRLSKEILKHEHGSVEEGYAIKRLGHAIFNAEEVLKKNKVEVCTCTCTCSHCHQPWEGHGNFCSEPDRWMCEVCEKKEP